MNMFEDFSFDAASTRRRPSSPGSAVNKYPIDPRRRWVTSRRPPLHRYRSSLQSECPSPLSRTSKPAVPSVAELIDHLRQYSLHTERPADDECWDVVIPSLSTDEMMRGGSEADENFDLDEQAVHRANMNRRRYQRQANTRLMVEESHISSLETLVDDMITNGNQCSVSRSRTPTLSERASTPSLTSESSEDSEVQSERRRSTPVTDNSKSDDRPAVEFQPSEVLTMSWQNYTRRRCVTKNVTILRNRRVRGACRGVRPRV